MECESSSLVLLFCPVNCLSPGATGYYQAMSREGGGYNCVYPMSSGQRLMVSAQVGSAQQSRPPKHPQVRVSPGVPREEGAGEETLPLQQLASGVWSRRGGEMTGQSPRLFPQLLAPQDFCACHGCTPAAPVPGVWVAAGRKRARVTPDKGRWEAGAEYQRPLAGVSL